MKSLISILFITCFTSLSHGQFFEGKMVFKNSYQSKVPNLSSEQLSTMLGSIQEYYIQGATYKSVSNGSMVKWNLYNPKLNTLYSKLSNKPGVQAINASINEDSVINFEINRNVTKVLNYPCDELVLTCKSGIQKYYFCTKFRIDAALYKNHQYGNWYDVLSRTGSLPIKSIIETSYYTLINELIEVNEIKLDSSMFVLDKE